MQCTFTGKIIRVGSIVPVNGKIKEKCTFLVRDEDGREIAFLVFDENIHKFLEPLEIGDKIKVDFSIKTQSFTNKFNDVSYVTNCYALYIEKIEQKKERRQRRSSQDSEESYRGKRHWEQTEPPPWEHQTKSTTTVNWFKGCVTDEDVKKRYRELCKQYHPDKPGGDVEKMQEINKQHNIWK